MPAQWDKTLETGDPLVDQQHKRIHQIFYDLEAAEDTPGEIMRVLDRLTVHVAAHFATEEDLMVREDFDPNIARLHRAEHQKLTDDTREFVLKFRVGELTSTAPLVAFLREWLGGHVESWDRVLIDHVRARGAAAVLPEPWASSPALDTLAS